MGWVFPWQGDMTQQLRPVQTHLSLSLVTVPAAPYVRTAAVFGNGILQLSSSAIKQVHCKPPTPLVSSFPHLLTSGTSIYQNLTTALENSLPSLFDFTQPIASCTTVPHSSISSLWPVSALSHPRILSVELHLSSGTWRTRTYRCRPVHRSGLQACTCTAQTWACGFNTSTGRRGKIIWHCQALDSVPHTAEFHWSRGCNMVGVRRAQDRPSLKRNTLKTNFCSIPDISLAISRSWTKPQSVSGQKGKDHAVFHVPRNQLACQQLWINTRNTLSQTE